MRCWKTFFVTPPAEYRKPGVVWKIKRYLYGDKRALRGWQDHFEKTMLELGFERLESEPGCFVKKGATHKDTIIVVVHVDDLLSVGKRKHLLLCATGENVETQACVVHFENGKSVLFLGDYITKFNDKFTVKSKDACVDNVFAMLGMESCKSTSTPMVRKDVCGKRRPRDAGMLKCRDVSAVSTCITRQSLWQWRVQRRPRVT